MARRYWVKVGGRKHYVGATLAELRTAAQNAANNLGRAVQVGYDEPRARRSTNAGRPRSSAGYQRNPGGRPPGRGDDWTGVRSWATVDHRGRVVTSHAYRAQADAHAAKWGLAVVPAHYEAGRLVLDSGRPATFKRNPAPTITKARYAAIRKALSKAGDAVWKEANGGPNMRFSEARAAAPRAGAKYDAALSKLYEFEAYARDTGRGYKIIHGIY